MFKNFKSLSRKQKITLAVLGPVLVGAVGYFLVYSPIVQSREKAAFTQAQKELESFEQRIEAEVGGAEHAEHKQECFYAARKFSRGPRSCRVSLLMVYGVENEQQASDIAQKANGVVASKDKSVYELGDKREKISYVPMNTPRDHRQEFAGDLNIQPETFALGCRADYKYTLSKDSYSYYSKQKPQTLSISLICTGEARAEYFPVVD